MKTKLMLRIIFFILTIATCIMIFGFSSEDGEKSSSTSEKVTRQIIDIYPKTKKLSETEKIELVIKIQPVIRKLAHFTEYAILGFSLMGFLCTYDIGIRKAFLIAVCFGIIYATSDEIHQGFTGGGRSPQPLDVCIDSLGTTCGTFIVTIIKLYVTKKEKYNTKNT